MQSSAKIHVQVLPLKTYDVKSRILEGMSSSCTRFERKIGPIITLAFVVRIDGDLIYLTDLCQNFEF